MDPSYSRFSMIMLHGDGVGLLFFLPLNCSTHFPSPGFFVNTNRFYQWRSYLSNVYMADQSSDRRLCHLHAVLLPEPQPPQG